MIHYSCDRCGRSIDPEDELRYVVRIEIDALMDPVDGEAVDDTDRDHLMELHEIIERHGDDTDSAIGNDVYQRKRFDLCSECHRKFAQNPLGKDQAKQLNFSNN